MTSIPSKGPRAKRTLNQRPFLSLGNCQPASRAESPRAPPAPAVPPRAEDRAASLGTVHPIHSRVKGCGRLGETPGTPSPSSSPATPASKLQSEAGPQRLASRGAQESSVGSRCGLRRHEPGPLVSRRPWEGKKLSEPPFPHLPGGTPRFSRRLQDEPSWATGPSTVSGTEKASKSRHMPAATKLVSRPWGL